MRLTRAGWEVLAVATALAVLAALFATPLLLLGAALVGAWVLARQVAFTRAIARLTGSLTVEQRATRQQVNTGDAVTLTLAAHRDDQAMPLHIEITANPPGIARLQSAAPPTLDLTTLTDVTDARPIELPIAGTVELAPPTVTVRDPHGLFRTSFPAGNAVSLTVESRSPGPIHVGSGGEGIISTYGEHEGGAFGSGLTPEELRKYEPGDPADRIDWKALARFGEPYVRVFTAESDLETVFVFDHRAPMGVGRDGATKLDYAREVALTYLARAREMGDPVGLYTVGVGGVTRLRQPAANQRSYAWIRQSILQLQPDDPEDASTETPQTVTPETAHTLASRLQHDGTMGEVLQPFFDDTSRYARRIQDRPLYGAVRIAMKELREDGQLVIITDDTDRIEVREAIKLVRSSGRQALCLLTPEALFRPGELADLEATYQQYVDFETFRRDLDHLDRVRALEVAPGDRIGAVLDDARQRRARA